MYISIKKLKLKIIIKLSVFLQEFTPFFNFNIRF